jgi:hypothetical protein
VPEWPLLASHARRDKGSKALVKPDRRREPIGAILARTVLMCSNLEPLELFVSDTLALPAEGVESASDLASRMLARFVEAASIARLDTTIAATFMVAELLAALRTHAGVEPEHLVSQFRHLIDRRSAEMMTGTTGPCGFTRGPDLADLDKARPPDCEVLPFKAAHYPPRRVDIRSKSS